MKGGTSARRVVTWALVLIPLSLLVATGEVRDQKQIPRVVDVEWLKKNLSAESMRIVDVRDDIGLYRQGHIPGAAFLSLDSAGFVEATALTSVLGQLGIDEKTLVVIYSGESDARATWLALLLNEIGHSRSAILDGGFRMWTANRGKVSQTIETFTPRSHVPVAKPDEDAVISDGEARQRLVTSNAVLLETCSGQVNSASVLHGLVGSAEGALPHSWEEDLEPDGTWKKEPALRKTYEALGATSDRMVLVTCADERMSSHTYFTLKHILGYSQVKVVRQAAAIDLKAGTPPDKGGAIAEQGDALLKSRCATCHGLGKVTRRKLDRAGWEKTVNNMIRRGAKLNEQERIVLIDHLSERKK